MQPIINHTSGDFSPNSMITQEDVIGVQLNGLHTLGVTIMWIKCDFPDANLILYKSNLSATYHQLLMHPLYQILQIVTVDGQRYIDRNNNFSGWASQIIWQSFMLLMIWILVSKHSIGALKYYIDDAYSVTRAENVSWYKLYHWTIPTDQVKILCLWDEIDLPHAEKKWVSGRIITILRFEVDVNVMSVYLSIERQEQLVDSIHKLSSKTLWAHNPILILVVNVLLQCDIDLRVVYILGPLNHVTNTLLQYQINLIRKLVPAIQIEKFTPHRMCWGL